VSLGSGFTAAKTATGKYTVTFTSAFSATPSVVPSLLGPGTSDSICYVQSAAVGSADVWTLSGAGAALADRAFSFIAIGPK
jgi:hypothetical protein